MCPSVVIVHTKDYQRLRDLGSLHSKKKAQKKAGNVHFEQIPATGDVARGGALWPEMGVGVLSVEGGF